LAARSANVSLTNLEECIHRAYRAGAALAPSDGRWPAIGDVDSARAFPVAGDDFWDFRPLCHLGAAIFNDPQLKFPKAGPGEELYWLLGSEGVERFDALGSECPAAGAAVLPHSGYAVARSGRGDWLLFDAGPIADGLHADATPSAAHGHADTLQVLYRSSNRSLFSDPGTETYAGALRRLDYFRSPAAHNTLEIDGAPHVRAASRLAWSHVAPHPTLVANLSDEAWLSRAVAEWAPGVRVERHVLALPGVGLWIADAVRSETPRHVHWYWQLPEIGNPNLDDDASVRWTSADKQYLLASWSTAADVEIEQASASPDSPVAWQSPGYGQLRACSRLSFTVRDITRLVLCTFVGKELLPTEVTIDNETLACKKTAALPGEIAGDSGKYLVRPRIDAPVLWKVQTADGVLSVLGGCESPPTDEDWKPLEGAGAWPALIASRELALGSTLK
jgi:hypothetical protein